MLHSKRPVKRKYLVSLPFEMLTRRVEEILPDWVKLERLESSDASSARYSMSHRVSGSEVWDCGELIVRRFRKAPAALLVALGRRSVDKQTFSLWSGVVTIEPTDGPRAARDHHRLAMDNLWHSLPPNTFARPEKPTDDALKALQRTIDIGRSQPSFTEAVLGPPPPRLPAPVQVEGINRPGRPLLDRDEVIRRRRIVQDAERLRKKTGDKWGAIAGKLKVPERTLRQWRHDTRFQRKRRKRQKTATNGGG